MSVFPDAPELLVLGSGAAGFYCALAGARAGMHTVLVEKAELGGTAFRWGCLPVKMALDRLKERSRLPGAASRRDGRCLRAGDASVLSRVTASLAGVERRLQGRLLAAGVEILHGGGERLAGEFLDERTYRLGDRRLRPRHLVIATGTSPTGMSAVPLDGRSVISHRELFTHRRLPASVAVVGADVEGAELSVLLAGVGVRVTLVERFGELLPGLDRDLADPVEAELREVGVRFVLGSPVTGLSRGKRGAVLELENGGSVEAGGVLVTGLRRANLPAGLERTGVETTDQAGFVRVQPSLATNVAGIYAAGDVNGLLGMAHAAIQQGTLLARSLRTGTPLSGEEWDPYAHPPRAIYTTPEIGGAGPTEAELRAVGTPYRVARVELRDTWRGLSRDPGDGFLKLLSDTDGRVLGVWMSGTQAAEASALFGLLLDRGLRAGELAAALVTHPTVAESLREAALAADLASGDGTGEPCAGQGSGTGAS